MQDLKDDSVKNKNGEDQYSVFDELKELGFSEDEAKIYITLRKADRKKAKDISKSLRMHKVQVYRCLKRMESRGIIKSSIGKPRYFISIPIEELIDFNIETRKAELSQLINNKKKIAEALKTIDQIKSDDAEPVCSFLEEITHIQAATRYWARKAEKEILFFGDDLNETQNALEDTTNLLKNFVNRGLNIKIITKTSNNNNFVLNLAKRFRNVKNFEVRTTDYKFDIFPRFFITDRKEIIMGTGKTSNGITQVALNTNNMEIVTAMVALFNLIWTQSKDLKGASLEKPSIPNKNMNGNSDMQNFPFCVFNNGLWNN